MTSKPGFCSSIERSNTTDPFRRAIAVLVRRACFGGRAEA